LNFFSTSSSFGDFRRLRLFLLAARLHAEAA
jgi:hypothetical protein